MLVPFMGTLILFNHTVLDTIRIPEEIMTAWGLDRSISSKDASLARLKLTYFGLCFIGIASFIFTLICPAVVKRYASAAEYIRGDKPLFTGPQIEEATGMIISNFIQRSRETDEDGRKPTFSCPQPLLRQTYVFLGEVATLMLTRQEEEERLHRETHPDIVMQPNDGSDEIEEEKPEWLETKERYFLWKDRAPGADVDKILNIIQVGIMADRMIFYNMTSTGRDFPNDSMSLSYFWQDCSLPFVRMIISLIYFAGFALLSIPTIFTFLSVLRQTLF